MNAETIYLITIFLLSASLALTFFGLMKLKSRLDEIKTIHGPPSVRLLNMLVEQMNRKFPTLLMRFEAGPWNFIIQIYPTKRFNDAGNERISDEMYRTLSGINSNISAWALLIWYLDSEFDEEPPLAAYRINDSVGKLHELTKAYYRHNSGGYETPQQILAARANERDITTDMFAAKVKSCINALHRYLDVQALYEGPTNLVFCNGREMTLENVEHWFENGGDLRATDGTWVLRTEVEGKRLLDPWNVPLISHEHREAIDNAIGHEGKLHDD